jgi:predicted transcriptional regulator
MSDFKSRLQQAVTIAGGPSEVSRASDLPLSTLCDYLSGTEPRFTRVARLAKACKVSLDWLAFGDDSDGQKYISIGAAISVLDAFRHKQAVTIAIRHQETPPIILISLKEAGELFVRFSSDVQIAANP